MSKRGTRKSTILKRRHSASDRLRTAGRAGLALLSVACLFAAAVFVADGKRYWEEMTGFASEKIAHAGKALGFELKNVLVEGRDRIPADELQSLLSIEGGEAILGYDLKGAADRLKDIPWIREARIERRLPDTLVVMIDERKAEALWQADGKVKVIDRDGVVVSQSVTQKDERLLLLVGADAAANANELLGALEKAPKLRGQIDHAAFVGARRWDVVLGNGIVIKLPEKHLDEALTRLSKVQEEEDILSKPLEHVDLRDPQRIIVRAKSGQAGDIPLDLTKLPADPA